MVTKKRYQHNTHHVNSDQKHNISISNNIPSPTTSQVTDQRKSLSNNEIKLPSLKPKFIMKQKLNDDLLLDMKHISAGQSTN